MIPSWAKEGKIAQKLINARAETVTEKPAFRKCLERQRCLILADGFYEWRREGKVKVPFFIRRRGGLPFGLAGLWDEWGGEQEGGEQERGEQEKGERGKGERGRQGGRVRTCTIITTEANALVRTIHERMPVLLTGEACRAWVDEKVAGREAVGLLGPYAAEEMEMYRVSGRVNSALVEGAELVERVREEQERGEQEKGEQKRGGKGKKREEPGLWG